MDTFFDGVDYVNQLNGFYFVSSSPLNDFSHLNLGNYELYTKNYQLKDSDTVVDLGAGEGEEISRYLKEIGKNGTLIAIESHPDAFRRMSKMVALNRFDNVICLNAAVSDREGTKVEIDSSTYSHSSSVRFSDLKEASDFSSSTLDTLLLSMGIYQIDFLKMNIEGSEIMAVEGMSKIIDRVQNVTISCHDFLAKEEFCTFDRVWELLMPHFHLSKNDPSELYPWQKYYIFGKSRYLL